MSEPFSKRYGYHESHQTEITIRQDAPYELRGVVVQLAYDCGFQPTDLRALICRVLRKRPDQNNWSNPNIDSEVHRLIDDCEWYRVYDVIEGIVRIIGETPYSYETERFESELNDYFFENGIGWKLIEGRIEIRGSESFEKILRSAESQLETKGFNTAQNELHEALLDLSRRPTPDVTGAIQHSMAALECVARKVCGDEKATLGYIMKRYENLIPPPLNEVVSKVWGYASENARHIRERGEPTFEEAVLIVSISSAITTYLTRKA